MIKKIFFAFVRYSGLLRVWVYINRDKINILMLHGVIDHEADPSWNPLWDRLSRERLDRYLGMLSRYYQFVSLDDAVDMLSGNKRLERNCIVLTFDDGYRNNITHALPILKKYGVTATIFVATKFVTERSAFLIDRLDYALQSVKINGRKISVGDSSSTIQAASREEFKKSYSDLRTLFREQYQDEIVCTKKLNELSEDLEKESGKSLSDIFESDGWSGLLTWDEIRKTNHTDAEYGSHTVDHYRLGQLDTAEMSLQLDKSKLIMEKELGEVCKHICYPVGSYNSETITIAEKCGYISGVTTEPGLNSKGDNLFSLKRISFPTKGGDNECMLHLTGLQHYLAELKSRLRA